MRISQGGHEHPSEKLIARFPRTIAILKAAIQTLPIVLIFDHEDISVPFQKLAEFGEGELLRCRTPGIDLRPLAGKIREQVEHVATLKFTAKELEFLSQLAYISPDFLDFLRVFKLNADAVQITERDGALDIRVRGTQVHVSWWEIYLLSIISELHARYAHPDIDEKEGHRRLTEKIRAAKHWQDSQGSDGKAFRLIEFGTRRRY